MAPAEPYGSRPPGAHPGRVAQAPATGADPEPAGEACSPAPAVPHAPTSRGPERPGGPVSRREGERPAESTRGDSRAYELPGDSDAPDLGPTARPEVLGQAPAVLGPAVLGPAGLGPTRLGPTRLGPTRLGPTRLGPTRLGPTRLEPTRLEPTRLGPTRLGPTRLGPTRLGPTRLGPTRLGPTRLGPTRLEPTRLEPTRLEPTRPGVPSHSHCPTGTAAGGSRAGFCG
ncbi:hypothetical protein GCM10027176_20620 [Actinoallomurus bryophytorum]